MTCPKCNDTGVWETGNNDLPCDQCSAGATAVFNVAGVPYPMTGAQLRARREEACGAPPSTLRAPPSIVEAKLDLLRSTVQQLVEGLKSTNQRLDTHVHMAIAERPTDPRPPFDRKKHVEEQIARLRRDAPALTVSWTEYQPRLSITGFSIKRGSFAILETKINYRVASTLQGRLDQRACGNLEEAVNWLLNEATEQLHIPAEELLTRLRNWNGE